MKAVIVINYASEEDIGKKTSIHLLNEENEWVEDVVIKPLPEKDEEPEDDMEDYIHADYDRMASYYYGLINGRNNVINEILGEYDAVD